MQRDEQTKLSLSKRVFYTLLDIAGAFLGGALFFICCYWFFHFETWHERFIAIGLSVLVVYILARIVPERPNQ